MIQITLDADPPRTSLVLSDRLARTFYRDPFPSGQKDVASVVRAPMAATSITSAMDAGSMMSATIGAMTKGGGCGGFQRRALCDRANYGSNISKGHRCRR